jgi:hypothetical protein
MVSQDWLKHLQHDGGNSAQELQQRVPPGQPYKLEAGFAAAQKAADILPTEPQSVHAAAEQLHAQNCLNSHTPVQLVAAGETSSPPLLSASGM